MLTFFEFSSERNADAIAASFASEHAAAVVDVERFEELMYFCLAGLAR